MVLMVGYTVANKARDLSGLHKAIMSSGAWWHHLETLWLVDTSESPTDMYKKLAPHITKSDHLLVMRVTGDYYGWLPQDAHDWLGKREF